MKIIGYNGKLTEHDELEVLGLIKLQKEYSEKMKEINTIIQNQEEMDVIGYKLVDDVW